MTVGAGLREEAEIAVVGAGPAGCTAATMLAELGHDVLLIDKHAFPREKPCGDGLMQPAVEAAQRMGLGELIDSSAEMESIRLVVGHRRQEPIHFPKAPGRPLPRCITREAFDSALLFAATERGARFLRARVDGLEPGPQGQRLLMADDEDRFEVKAGLVIAADGATSRIRRLVTGRAEKPTAYAIRQYFRTERPLDPVLQVDIPIEVDGRILPGYGWVFRIDEHTANIGVGTNREEYHRAPSLRAVLAAYVSELETKAARRFGDLEPIGEPVGSPVGIRAQIEVAKGPGVALVGDSAGTTSAITGEGISFAMRGAEALAAAVHSRSKRGRKPQAEPRVGAEVWHAFPQLGIDTSVMVRASMLKMNKAAAESAAGNVSEPFLTTIWRIGSESAYETRIEGTPAWAALNACDPALADSLERTNDVLLERLADPTPFVTEVIHDSIRAHLGPMYAAVVLATAVADDPRALPPPMFVDAGVAVESAGVLPKLLMMLVDRATFKQLKFNNAMAVLTGDFTATRALMAAAKLGPEAAAALLRTCQGGCEGGMRDAVTRFATNRSPDNWLLEAQEIEGEAMVLATLFGATISARGDVAPELRRKFGLELGVAVRLAEEVVDLIGDGNPSGTEGESIARGVYSLPVLYAIEAEPSLPRLLAQASAEQRGGAEIVAVIRETGALDRAIAECRERSEAARSFAAGLGGNDEALSALAAAPVDYVASHLSVDVLEAR